MTEQDAPVALVTGASRGLGRAIALGLARAGASVALTDILVEGEAVPTDRLDGMGKLALAHDLVRTAQTAEEINQAGGRAVALKMDVTAPAEIDSVFSTVEKMWGPVGILVNNAAVFDHRRRFPQQSLDLWQRDLLVNLTGPFLCAQRAWDGMVAGSWGRIVNLSSAAGLMGGYGQASYSAAKAGIIGLTKTLALEGARSGITANAVAPGPIATEGFTMKASLGIDPSMNERIIRATAARRMGVPDDIANTVAFLASREAGYITGQTISVNGGLDLFVF